MPAQTGQDMGLVVVVVVQHGAQLPMDLQLAELAEMAHQAQLLSITRKV
jgi:hypothetical protein